MSDITSKLGLYVPPSPKDYIDFVHPEDVNRFARELGASQTGQGWVFECFDAKGGYLSLRNGPFQYRLSKKHFRPLADLTFSIGDRVQTTIRTRRNGTIREIGWHYKREEVMYFIQVGDKKISRRYFANDLQRANKADDI